MMRLETYHGDWQLVGSNVVWTLSLQNLKTLRQLCDDAIMESVGDNADITFDPNCYDDLADVRPTSFKHKVFSIDEESKCE